MGNCLREITNYLWTQSWQIAFLTVIIAAVSLLLKNKSAHIRYLLWMILLVKCFAPPLLTVPLAVLPQERIAPPIIESVAKNIPAIFVETAEAAGYEPAALPAVAAELTIFDRFAAVTMSQWLGAAWILGVVIFVLMAGIKSIRLNRWLKRTRKPLAVDLQRGIKDLFAEFGEKKFPKVWLVDGIGQPFVWGLLRGSIYLPSDFAEIEAKEHRRGILSHELSHVLRFDAAVNLLQITAQAVFWFHPLVWWANKKIRAEREKCCDEMAIAALGTRAGDFSTAIVNILTAEHKSALPIPSLAVAGPVKNIEDRIKTIMNPNRKFYKRPTILTAITILLLAIITVPTTLALTSRSDKKRMDLENTVVEGIIANRDKFECGILAWSRKYINVHYEDPRGNQSGQYELWWDGNKMTTKYLRDEVYGSPEVHYRAEKRQGGNSYDGGVLSRKPKFREDNWLGPQITRWRGQGSQDWLIRQDSKQKNISKDWSVIEKDGVKLIRSVARNMNETSVDYRAYSIEDYDPSKGCGMVNQEWYNPDGSPRVKHTVKLLEVIPGGWFPVEVDFKSFTITDGSVYTHNHSALDIKRCSFNDRAALPDRIFKQAVDKQLKYQEKLQKYLAMELKGLSNVKEAAKTDKVKRGAREAIEKFVAAAMAGDLEQAAEYAHPRRLPANLIEELHKMAKDQDPWIMAVVADNFDAVAVTSVIRGDHERIGPLVFSLNRVTQDGRDNWWVDDIDMETPDGAEGVLKSFLGEHPEAQKITSDKKPDAEVEGQMPVFKPTIEITINDNVAVGKESNIDFDTGRLFARPENWRQFSNDDWQQWIEKTGIDASGATRETVRGLMCNDMIISPMNNYYWDDAVARLLATNNLWKTGQPGSPAYMTAQGKLPVTYIFKTHEGGIGILQITGFGDEPGGVNIRYKMVQETAVGVDGE